ncbi:MAG: DUF1553 domain-containing protein [Pirellulaceae bacterium]
MTKCLCGLWAQSCWGLVALLLTSPAWSAPPEVSVQFARDIAPILSDNCYQCHGPDAAQREAELRLDRREGLFERRDSSQVVTPGSRATSHLWNRITAKADDERMPPRDSGKSLSAEQVALIGRWIDQGADWQGHWSFIKPRQVVIPVTGEQDWGHNAIDRFVLSRLEQEQLQPSREAKRETLIRRVMLDLTGLPPSPTDVADFLADQSPGAYERLVDRLLAAPQFGERMAVQWLDAARYADTSGYQTDGERFMWRWRDWVIGAYNRGMPFDQFTIEQLAGDLLPNSTVRQRVATGFHRNHRANSEGGIVFDEFLVEYAADRVETTATVWLGLTMTCARCHDHKYDPFTQRDYYQLMAYFNNVPEQGRVMKYGNSVPVMRAPTAYDDRALAAVAEKLEQLAVQQAARRLRIERAQRAWEQGKLPAALDGSIEETLQIYLPLDGQTGDQQEKVKEIVVVPEGALEFRDVRRGQALFLDGQRYVEIKDFPHLTGREKFSLTVWVWASDAQGGTLLSLMDDGDSRDKGLSLFLQDGHLHLNYGPRWLDDALRVRTRKKMVPERWYHVGMTYDGSHKAAGLKLYIDGQAELLQVDLDIFTGTFKTEYPLRLGSKGTAPHFQGQLDDLRFYRRELAGTEVQVISVADTVAEIAQRPPAQRTPAQRQKIDEYYLRHQSAPEVRKTYLQRLQLRRRQREIQEQVPTTMVMQDQLKLRDTFILKRGQYDQPGERVEQGVPAVLPRLPAGAPPNRLGLARWLVDRSNPLTARVAVNRYWAMYFGAGLVRTPEDYGSQGERPTHPALLDWLAAEFVRLDWDVKAVQRLIVTSATYRQSSQVSEQGLRTDPTNRWLSRAPRFRLPAEVIRDQALAAGGLLVRTLGGPSVRPYQPEGLWKEIASDEYVQDHGSRLYRRSMYTFWKRTVPPPTMMTFDATSRELCVMSRSQTNTPLQALALLNDTTYIEAARGLASRMMLESRGDVEHRLDWGFRVVLSRAATAPERTVLVARYRQVLEHYRGHRKEASLLLSIGESPVRQQLDTAELAAYTILASLLFNLDETVMRE